jgi:PilZ domain
MKQEKRTRTRVPVHFDVVINISGEEIPVKTWDISTRGMQCSADHRFIERAACQVIFILSSEVKIVIEGKITRVSEDGAGIYFAQMNEDSFYHLRKLVEYNTDEPDNIEKEIAKTGKSCS